MQNPRFAYLANYFLSVDVKGTKLNDLSGPITLHRETSPIMKALPRKQLDIKPIAGGGVSKCYFKTGSMF